MSKNKKTIAFLLDWISSIYHIEIVASMEDIARKNNINLVTLVGGALNSPKSYEDASNYLYKYISSENIDGIIIESGLLGLYSSDEDMVNFCKSFSPIPVVSLSEKIRDVSSVTIENTKGLEEIILHLIDTHKYKKIAFLSGPEENPDAKIRLDVYKNALKSRNIKVDPDYILPGLFTRKSAKEAVQKMLKEGKIKPEVIACANDDMAVGVLEELKKNNIKIPEDIAVTGFDDQKDCEYLDPPLTTVRRPIYSICDKSVEILINLMNNNDLEDSAQPCEPVIRSSCGCDNSTPDSKKTEKGLIKEKFSCPMIPGNIENITSLIEVYRNIGYTRNIKRLIDYLNWALPVLKIKKCSYAVFENNNLLKARPLLSYKEKNEPEIKLDLDFVNTEEYVKNIFKSSDELNIVRIFSSIYDEVVYGIFAYEVSDNVSVLTDTMRNSYLINVINAIGIHFRKSKK